MKAQCSLRPLLSRDGDPDMRLTIAGWDQESNVKRIREKDIKAHWFCTGHRAPRGTHALAGREYILASWFLV